MSPTTDFQTGRVEARNLSGGRG